MSVVSAEFVYFTAKMKKVSKLNLIIKTLWESVMDIEIACKGHYEKLSHFLDLVSHTELVNKGA